MYEPSMKFRKKFRYHISLEEPPVGKNDVCYAFALQFEKSEYCDVEQKHHHLPLESSSKFQRRGRRYAVPCLQSTFSFQKHATNYLKLNGNTIEKLNRVVSHNKNPDNRSPFFRNTKRLRKRVPVVRKRNEKSARTSE